MQTEPQVCFFLGANSPSGFYSLYDQLMDPARARDIFILKGGPGCGKSSLMGRVGKAAAEKGLAVEYIACSGDPDSLDAVILPQLDAAIVDGTAPHAVVTLGHFWWTSTKRTAKAGRDYPARSFMIQKAPPPSAD